MSRFVYPYRCGKERKMLPIQREMNILRRVQNPVLEFSYWFSAKLI